MGNENDPKLSLIGYKAKGVELAIACNHPNGIVLSIGDNRIELCRQQFFCLYDLIQQFMQANTEL